MTLLITFLLSVTALENRKIFADDSRSQKIYTVKYPLDGVILEGKQSYYSKRIGQLLKNWPPCDMPLEGSSPVWMQPIRTPNRPNYIGLRKRVHIHVPISKVKNLIDDFQSYKNIFSDVKEVLVTNAEGNKITTFWKRPSPVFFVSSTEYTQIYLIDSISESKIAYRYQLKSGNHVNFSDGLIVLEQDHENTLLTAFDFFEADWGLLRTLAENTIWKNSLEGSLRGDFEFKAHAEHPEWSKDQIKSHADKLIDTFPIQIEKLTFLKDLDKIDCGTAKDQESRSE